MPPKMHYVPTRQRPWMLPLSIALILLGFYNFFWNSEPKSSYNGPSDDEILADADDVMMRMECIDQPYVMRGKSLAAAEIKNEFAADKYGICDPEKTGLDLGGTVLDIGGNIGMFAITTLLRYPKARVVTVEPLHRNRVFLKYNAKKHAVDDRLTILPHGITADGRTVLIKYYENNPASSRAPKGDELGDPYIERVPTRSLQAVLNDVGPVKVLKIDCEGCEQEVMFGTPALMDPRRVGRVVGEVHYMHNPRMQCLMKVTSKNHMAQFQCD